MPGPLVLGKESGNTNVNAQKIIKKIMDCGGYKTLTNTWDIAKMKIQFKKYIAGEIERLKK